MATTLPSGRSRTFEQDRRLFVEQSVDVRIGPPFHVLDLREHAFHPNEADESSGYSSDTRPDTRYMIVLLPLTRSSDAWLVAACLLGRGIRRVSHIGGCPDFGEAAL